MIQEEVLLFYKSPQFLMMETIIIIIQNESNIPNTQHRAGIGVWWVKLGHAAAESDPVLIWNFDIVFIMGFLN